MSEEAVESTPRENPWTTVTRWLLVINVAVFVLDAALAMKGYGRAMRQHDGTPIVTVGADGQPAVVGYPLLASFGYFSFDLAIYGKEIWRFVTYQFCHANIEHILVNMMGLLLAGPIVEERLGRARFLCFYLLCGVAGPLAHLVFGYMGLMNVNLYTPLVGASASIYGVLVAAAMIAPNEIVMLAFPPIDVRLKTLAWVMIGFSAAAVLWRWENAGGHAAHIGGVVVGWFLGRRMIAHAGPPPEERSTSPGSPSQ